MFLEERVQRKITYLWFSWESWCLCICITCGCRFITNKAFKQKNVSFQNLIRKKRVIYFNLVYLYGSWSQQSNYETLCSRKHVLTLSKNNNNIKKNQNTNGKCSGYPSTDPLQQVPQMRYSNSASPFCGLLYFTFKMPGYTSITDCMERKLI